MMLKSIGHVYLDNQESVGSQNPKSIQEEGITFQFTPTNPWPECSKQWMTGSPAQNPLC